MAFWVDFETSNVVGYLLAPASDPPRISSYGLGNFLEGLAGEEIFVSRDERISGFVHSIAERQLGVFGQWVAQPGNSTVDAVVDPDTLRLILEPLVAIFEEYYVV